MKSLFDDVSVACSKLITRKYSTSFSLGISFLSKKFHAPVYSIYGFVRLADEIVDSFHGFDKEELLTQFKKDTREAIGRRISLNPVLNAFQEVVHAYNIESELVEKFLHSMTLDLKKQDYTEELYREYILGSAEVVGLMCLRIFTEKDDQLYKELRPSAMKLGSAFQKVNFLRDLRADFEKLGRSYFPDVDLNNFSGRDKLRIEAEIEEEFKDALTGIKKLPPGARCGVYLAYVYYRKLFNKIKGVPAETVMKERIRISNGRKFGLMINSVLRHRFNIL
ncbi:MAG: phytoene/squalene synthase family protein [Bacteroidetes bacterium]|nr:MAG: phytoene/squalene synthase family protein [Bacteroidota bacterium]